MDAIFTAPLPGISMYSATWPATEPTPTTPGADCAGTMFGLDAL
ncbi:hypothetical protein FM103_11435 [Corynebacterium xerosis]|nr:hypothetical protein FM103_11435 [Corynebacterium xerosis]